jgi:ubiquinone/menaquinone biosynthesis C-methylase UbiE/uncharacterized membrane protein YbhN (UPF0104 family)
VPESPALGPSRATRLVLLCLAGTAAVGLAATGAFLATHETPLTIDFGLLLAGLVTAGLTIAGLYLRFLRWHFVLRRLHVRLPTIPSLGAYVGSFAFLPVPLYLGQLLARVHLLSIPAADRSRVVAAFVWERALDVWALALLAAPLLPWPLAMVAYGAAAAVFLPGADRVLEAALRRVATPLARVGNPDPSAPDPGMTTGLCAPAVLVPATLLSLAAWGLVAGALLPIAWAAGAAVGVLETTGAHAASIVAGALSGVPLGAGAAGLVLYQLLDGLAVAPEVIPGMVFVSRVGTAWLSIAIGIVALLRLPAARREASAHDHFDEIEACYDTWLPEHYRAHLVTRKTGAMLGAMPGLGPNPSGLDVGCGRGWYMTVLEDAGARLAGVDTSRAQLAAARRHLHDATRLAQASVERLPFESGHFDFVYIINVLHHVAPPSAQRAALAELARVVRPGGLVFVHEMNVRNPVFRFYLSYLFPVLKGIEEGTEYYLRPEQLGDLPGLRLRSVDYFTFLPDFVPASALRLLATVERRLERGPLGPYAAHFMTCHERLPGPVD